MVCNISSGDRDYKLSEVTTVHRPTVLARALRRVRGVRGWLAVVRGALAMHGLETEWVVLPLPVGTEALHAAAVSALPSGRVRCAVQARFDVHGRETMPTRSVHGRAIFCGKTYMAGIDVTHEDGTQDRYVCVIDDKMRMACVPVSEAVCPSARLDVAITHIEGMKPYARPLCDSLEEAWHVLRRAHISGSGGIMEGASAPKIVRRFSDE